MKGGEEEENYIRWFGTCEPGAKGQSWVCAVHTACIRKYDDGGDVKMIVEENIFARKAWIGFEPTLNRNTNLLLCLRLNTKATSIFKQLYVIICSLFRSRCSMKHTHTHSVLTNDWSWSHSVQITKFNRINSQRFYDADNEFDSTFYLLAFSPNLGTLLRCFCPPYTYTHTHTHTHLSLSFSSFHFSFFILLLLLENRCFHSV